MRRIFTLFSLFAALLAPLVAGEHDWDKNATAESLGLTRLEVPDDFYPVYAWDVIGEWGPQATSPETLAHSDAVIKDMAECMLAMPGFVSESQVENVEKYGLKMIVAFEGGVGIGGMLASMGYSPKLEDVTPEIADALVKKMVEKTKDNPNVLGYQIADEPGADSFAALANINAAVKKYAPGKIAYINLFPNYASTIGADRDSSLKTYSYEEYLERYVQEVKPMFISYDNYMVEYSEDMIIPERVASYWNNLLDIRRIAMKYNLPWWNIISSMGILPESTPPTPARLAFQAYTSLAAGCDGLGWFLYYDTIGFEFAPCDRKLRHRLTWGYMRDVNEQIQTYGKFLKNYRSSNVWFTSPAPMENLPENPKTLLSDLKVSFSENATKTYPDHTPQVMVGEFEAKDGSDTIAMFVNLSFVHSVKIEPEYLDGATELRMLSAQDGTLQKISDRGWWILPGNGIILVKKHE